MFNFLDQLCNQIGDLLNILDQLSNHIRGLLNILDVYEFGKDGPLAHGLLSQVLKQYDRTMECLQHFEARGEGHPEWHLAEHISGIRSYLDQTAEFCDEAKQTLGPHSPPDIVPDIVENEDETLRIAKQAAIQCYDDCFTFVVAEWILRGARTLSGQADPEGWLQQVDDAFVKAFAKITLLPNSENAEVQDLVQKSYRIWKESRRLLCDFRRPSGTLIP